VDVFCHATEGVVAEPCYEGSRTGNPECPGAMVQRPPSAGGGTLQAFNEGIELRGDFGVELREQSPSRWWHQHRQCRIVEVILAVGDDERSKAAVEGRGARCEVATVTQDRGLIAREHVSGKEVLIKITEQGQTVLADARPAHASSVRRHLLDRLSHEETKVLSKILTRLSAQLPAAD
jgi:hypothetical protein